jgi:hypothetical protein
VWIIAVLTIAWTPAVAQDRPPRYAGRPLAEALRALQNDGLRIVFSSEIVTEGMRVGAEPRAKRPRAVLDELLKAHGLKAEEGPGGVIQVVRAKLPDRPLPRTRSPAPDAASRGPAGTPAEAPGGGLGPFREDLTVTAPHPERRDVGVGSAARLGPSELQTPGGAIADDPLRAVQTLPGVATGDDFRSEFSVRGSGLRHVSTVVDGVATPWLQHTAYGRDDTGSVTMLQGAALEHAILQAGAYPRRHADRLGAELELTLREGSRVARRLRGALSGTNAALVAEGPIGQAARGSWLVGVRQSFLDWPVRELGREFGGTVLGFTDAHAKLVYDVRPRQQATVTILAGRSSVQAPDGLVGQALADGINRAAVLNVGWRSTFGSRLVLSQRAYIVAHEFANQNQAGQGESRGTDNQLSYAADIVRTVFGGLLEVGGQVQRFRTFRSLPVRERFAESPSPVAAVDEYEGSAWIRSGNANFRWRPVSRLTVSPGVRFADSTLAGRPRLARWVLGEWILAPGWTLNASAGVFHQFPEIDQVLGGTGAFDLTPERATPVDVGIEQRLARSVRWRVTFFRRGEHDVLRAPDRQPRLVAGVLVPPGPGRYENALSGTSRGVELLVERQSGTGLSGWVAYSYGRTRHTDAGRRETFWADFDQRHGINAFGVYRISDRTTVGARFRGGTNFPIPGYFIARDGRLFAGSGPNEVRLPGYARLDARATRTLTFGRRRLTLFGEVFNVLNRANLGLADGFIRPSGEAVGFTEPLIPRLALAGFVIEF